MAQTTSTQYGNWKSPVTAKAVAAQSFSSGIEEVSLDPKTGKVFYAQKRPEEGGRSAVVDASSGHDLFTREWDARTRVHEYGGGAFTVFDNVLYFSQFKDQRVYKVVQGEKPQAITPEDLSVRYADFAVHPIKSNIVVAVEEDHKEPHPSQVKTRLVQINTNSGKVTALVEGADFYACPRFSPDGQALAWQQWNFPELPFQSAEIFVTHTIAGLDDAKPSITMGEVVHVAGVHEQVSALEPFWISDTTLIFVSDASGYHNPWKFTFPMSQKDGMPLLEKGKASPILPLPIKEEFASPQWWLSTSSLGVLSKTKAVIASFRDVRTVLYIVDLEEGSAREVHTPYSLVRYVHGTGLGKVVFLGEQPDLSPRLIELSLDPAGKPALKTIFGEKKHSNSPAASDSESASNLSNLPRSFISIPQYHDLQASDGRHIHVNYYPPKSPDYKGEQGEKPPVVVYMHGGPYHTSYIHLDWQTQFYTTRGWAYLDVNYGGSTGFGRAFRESLHEKWGVLDIEDAWLSIQKLDSLGLVDSKRAVVHGGSAGGYAVLQIATSLPGTFVAGVPQYGISEMKTLDENLHKFEYCLCDRLMGGSYEEKKDVWIERSPIYHADRIKMPLLVLQGEEDTVVPAEQAVNMVEEIEAHGGKAKLVLFPGEGHGWRKSETIQKVLEEELRLFNEVLGFENGP